MVRILLTNDDGCKSVALVPTIEELEKIGEVVTVIPKYQQSWTSKANTRRVAFLEKEIIEIEGKEIITITGLPADCTNYGAFHFGPFDVVISGANIGHNVGLAAFFSSGTIGGALEALILDIPSIAISIPYSKGGGLTTQDIQLAMQGMSELIGKFVKYSDEKIRSLILNIPTVEEKKLYVTYPQKFSFGDLFCDVDQNRIAPNTYDKLNFPTDRLIETGSDVWAMSQQCLSLYALDSNGQITDRSYVRSWISQLKLKSFKFNIDS